MLLALQLYILVGVAFAIDAGVRVHREDGPAPAHHEATAFIVLVLIWGPLAIIAIAEHFSRERRP